MNSPFGLDVLSHVSDVFTANIRYKGTVYPDKGVTNVDHYTTVGTKTYVQSTNLSWSGTGVVSRSFYDQFYNTFHFSDLNLNLGNILSSITRPLKLWNAFLVSKDVTAFTPGTTEGLDVIEPVAAPFTLEALQEVEYQITVSESGPPQFVDSMSWIIDGVSLSVSITGNRVVIWGFKPNWSNPVTESLSWKTTVTTSFDQTEKRSLLRSNPRKRLEYSTLLKSDDLPNMTSQLFGWQNRLFAVPVWFDKSKLVNSVVSGDTSINVDTVSRQFTVGQIGVLLNAFNEFEVFEIESITDTTIQFAEGLKNDWPVDTLVYPVDLARANSSFPYRYLTDSVVEVVSEWDMMPGNTSLEFSDQGVQELYNGKEVLNLKPNWKTTVTVENEFDYVLFDSTVGLFDQVATDRYPSITCNYEFILKGKDEITEFKRFLNRRKGRWKSFYAPTQTNDFIVKDDLTEGSSSILIKPSNFTRYLSDNPVRSAVIIYHRDGTTFKAGITGFAYNDTSEMISINAAFDKDYLVKDVVKASFLQLCRLNVDEITFNYMTDSVVTVNMPVRTIHI